MKPYSIMHISDLHRSSQDPISNDELISALLHDRDRYVREKPSVSAPQAIVVSGDIIRGVPLQTEDFKRKIEKQYAVAKEFLDELVLRFLEGDRSRLIMVPGNHDVDWNTAFGALESVPSEEIPSDPRAELFAEDSLLRWDWKTRTMYRIVDPDLYEQRLNPFWQFFERFYQDVPGLTTAQYPSDVRLFDLCDGRIGVAAYNSCHGNDCFSFHGMIRRESIARSDLDLNDSGRAYNLRMAVWHHSIEGSPYRTDYMDMDVVRSLVGRGFRLGLHGHQHKSQVTAREIHLPDRERMAVVSAGSLCASPYELPVGIPRQYNILEIAGDFCSVRTHVREMIVANLFSRAQLLEFGGASFTDLNWTSPRNAVGQVVDFQSARIEKCIDEAELAASVGDSAQAVTILRSLEEFPPGSYQRQLFLQAAVDARDWTAIVDTTDPPTTIEELIQRFDAYYQLNDLGGAIACLDRYSQTLQLSESLDFELRSRARAKEAILR